MNSIIFKHRIWNCPEELYRFIFINTGNKEWATKRRDRLREAHRLYKGATPIK